MMIALGLAIAAQVGLILASLVFSALSIPPGTSWSAALAEPLAFGIVTLAFPTVGAVVVLRRPSHPVGRLLSVVALGWSLANGASSYATYALLARHGAVPGGEWALWLSGNSWTIIVSQGLLLLLMLLFPTGSLPSPSWRPVGWLAGGWTAVTVAAVAFAGGPLSDYLGLGIINPAAAPDPVGTALGALAGPLQLGWIVLFGVAAIALVVRFRHSRGMERQQLKWVAVAGLLAVVLVGGAAASLALLGGEPTSPEVPVNEWLLPFIVVGILSPGLLPVSIGLAILRYRLYDIDLVINRTLVYGSLTVLLGAVYVAGVVGLPMLVPLAAGNDLVVAGSTLGVAALFSPLRRRVQGFVDRRFYRRRYDAQRTVDAFAARLREQVDLEDLVGGLTSVVRETLQPGSVSVWLSSTSTGRAGRGTSR
jgi:hypothetical protein